MRERIRRVPYVLVLVTAGLVAALSLFFLLVGVPGTSVSEGSTDAARIFRRAPQAFIPLVAAGLVAAGVVTRRRLVAWAGAVLLVAFAVVFVFGVGSAFLPLALILAVLLAFATRGGPAATRAA